MFVRDFRILLHSRIEAQDVEDIDARARISKRRASRDSNRVDNGAARAWLMVKMT